MLEPMPRSGRICGGGPVSEVSVLVSSENGQAFQRWGNRLRKLYSPFKDGRNNRGFASMEIPAGLIAACAKLQIPIRQAGAASTNYSYDSSNLYAKDSLLR